MKKTFLIIFVALFSTFVALPNVFANTKTLLYSSTVSSRDTTYTGYLTANQNYEYALNNITSSQGSAAVHQYYQTKYNGSAVTIGGELTLSAAGYTGIALWKATDVSSNPTGYTITTSTSCSGSNSTSSYCAISGSQYRLKLVNKNYLYSFSISAQLTLTD